MIETNYNFYNYKFKIKLESVECSIDPTCLEWCASRTERSKLHNIREVDGHPVIRNGEDLTTILNFFRN